MLIIWRGLGFLPVIFLSLFGLIFLATQSGSPTDFTLGAPLLLTGVATSWLDYVLRKHEKERKERNEASDLPVSRFHQLFFVPIFYWGPAFIGAGLYLLIKATLKH